MGISVSPDGSKVYVANSGSNTVSVINSAVDTVLATIMVGNHPVSLGNFISIYPSLLGIESPSITLANIAVYPNPANDNITIDIVSFTKGEIISVYDIQGQLLLQQPMQQAKTNINISTLAKGVYFIKVKTANGMEVKKIVKD